MELEAALKQHAGHVALQFSGGRDSLAMLLLLRPYWDRVTVYYTASGDAYPETLALAHAVSQHVPRFVQIEGKVKETHTKHGWPSDVLPAGATWRFGKEHIKGHLPLIDRHNCCYLSIMAPMHERMRADDITLILRGQRDADEPKSHVKNGETVDGFTIMYPIADWSAEQVDAFIEAQGLLLPPYYAAGATSAPDCMHCTAWLETNAHKYLRTNHPAVASEVQRRLNQIKVSVEPFMRNLDLNAGAA
jgi:phosphoadenosine phosphosulfate reductase